MSDDLTPDTIPKQPAEKEPKLNEAEQQEFQLTEQEATRAMEVFREEQNLLVGSLGGLVAAVAGAAVWAGVTVVTEYQIGWMAVGVGFLVGIAVRVTGKGIDQIFGIVGAFMSLVGCALGNLLTIAYFMAGSFDLAMLDILSQMTVADVIGLLKETFQVMDILFYGLAVYFGYRYAFRELTMDDFNRALGRAM